MDSDRRESLRRDVCLPFQWQPIDTPLSADELGKLFDLPPMLQFSGRLADLEAEYSQACQEVRDPATSAVLALMNARLCAMQEAMFSQLGQPVERTIEISANGIAFAASEKVEPPGWLGLHFVLPSCYHVFCAARVCRCEASGDADGYRVAAQIESLDIAASRRLSRFVIGNVS